jgi:hypothetical protein
MLFGGTGQLPIFDEISLSLVRLSCDIGLKTSGMESLRAFQSFSQAGYLHIGHAKTALPNPISQMTTLAQRNTKF